MSNLFITVYTELRSSFASSASRYSTAFAIIIALGVMFYGKKLFTSH